VACRYANRQWWLIPWLLLALSAVVAKESPRTGVADEAATSTDGLQGTDAASGRLVKHGIVVEFEANPLGGNPGDRLMEGRLAEVRFRLTEAASGEPVRGITPGVWMDLGQVIQGRPDAQQKTCKEKIALYLKGVVGIRPMIDLNSYYVVVMNREASLSIIDPLVSMAGRTSTLAMIPLPATGADWAHSSDDKRLYVSMPDSDQVAVVDTDAFRLITSLAAGSGPTRLALQPDGRYLWVGNNADSDEASGVTVIDTTRMSVAGHIATGRGHHEMAFTSDSRYAFVSNRDSGTVSVIDVQGLRKLKDLAIGPLPISLDYSPLAGALYVADGRSGTITVVDGERLDVTTTIPAEPGLGPLRISPDGRFALTVNPAEDRVHVIDMADNTVVHNLSVAAQPYQVVFSEAFAYVRALGSERVTMISLASLGEGKKPVVQGFEAGSVAPKIAGDLPLADSIAPAASEAAMFVVNPADNTTYFYMEGMNAPSSNYKVYGGRARAVTVVDRSLRESEPGVYISRVKIPAAGRYDIAFLLDTPQVLHCFTAEADPNPAIRHDLAALEVEYLQRERRVETDATVPFRFRLAYPLTGIPATGLGGVRVLYFRAPGTDRTEIAAREEGDGIYVAELPLQRPGAYYVHVGVESAHVGYRDLPYFTLVAVKPPVTGATGDRLSSDGNG
jgi:YVTN family beta-propeller protein